MTSRPASATVWRALVPVVVAAAALLLVTSAVTARGTDLRSSDAVPVTERIKAEEATLASLTKAADRLRNEISTATAQVGRNSREVGAAQADAGRLALAAGLVALRGPSVTVSLNDASKADQQRDLAAGAAPDDLVIHQQDVQGVVNALWAGGADGMTIMGQRVVATSAVLCVGNTLLLHGQTYGPPFVITAVGNPAALRRALDADPSVSIFKQYVATYGLRYAVTTATATTLPTYTGPLELSHAKAVS
ncbi:MAG: hypothetical protein QOD07_1596 [Frankiaceae bacterium]|jgi:uncharacterized protein YlxW (UPF0749 family)|nr:hypothetical protein [Frankiaceae bacterium]